MALKSELRKEKTTAQCLTGEAQTDTRPSAGGAGGQWGGVGLGQLQRAAPFICRATLGSEGDESAGKRRGSVGGVSL